MRNSFILFVRVFLLMLGSCSIISYKSASVESDYVAKNGFMMAKPQLVDIEVEKRKIEGSATVDNKLYGGPAATDAAKNLAVMDAVERGDAGSCALDPTVVRNGTTPRPPAIR